MMIFAKVLSAIPKFILSVLLWCRPIDIVKRVNATAKDTVACEHSPRSWRYKGLKYDNGNLLIYIFAALNHENSPIIIGKSLFERTRLIAANRRIYDSVGVCPITDKPWNGRQYPFAKDHSTTNKNGSFIAGLFKHSSYLTANPEPHYQLFRVNEQAFAI